MLPPTTHYHRLLDKLSLEAGGCMVLTTGGRNWYKVVVIDGKAYNLRRLLYAFRKKMTALPTSSVRLTMTCKNPACYNPAHVEVIG